MRCSTHLYLLTAVLRRSGTAGQHSVHDNRTRERLKRTTAELWLDWFPTDFKQRQRWAEPAAMGQRYRGRAGGRVIQPYAGGLDTQMSWHLNPAIRYWLFHMCVTLPQELGQSNEPFRWGRGQRQQLQRIHTEPEQVCFSVTNSDLLKPPLMVHRQQKKKTHLFTCCDAAAAGRRPINTDNTKTHQK